MISSLLRIDALPAAVSPRQPLHSGEYHSTPSAAPGTEPDAAVRAPDRAFQDVSKVNLLGCGPGEASFLMSTSLIVPGQSPPSPDVKLLENGTTGALAEADGDVEKREREHKKRSKNWTRPETLKLIRLRTDLEPRFAKSGRKTELWDEIAEGLQKERITRDAQQCRDKWEKLTAGYKEVRDGMKEREDNPFYDELHPLLSGKSIKRERDKDKESYARDKDGVGKDLGKETVRDDLARETEREGEYNGTSKDDTKDDDDDDTEDRAPAKKKKKGMKYIAVTDVGAVQQLLESVMSHQQRFFKDLLDTIERKDLLRQEKEDKWRAEERTQRGIFNNAMLLLTQKLVGETLGPAAGTALGVPAVSSPEGPQGPKKRSKNWKRTEVLQLIKLRGEMESRFAKSTRRAALWDELAESLASQGIKRDGKQCREKWDKLMAEYKDVTDGKREQGESPYFAELTVVMGRPAEAG